MKEYVVLVLIIGSLFCLYMYLNSKVEKKKEDWLLYLAICGIPALSVFFEKIFFPLNEEHKLVCLGLVAIFFLKRQIKREAKEEIEKESSF